MTRTQTELNILPSFNGDSIFIKTYDENNKEIIILIDGGTPATFEYTLKKNLKDIVKIDILVLTHIDNDHIGGLINFFKNSISEKIEIGEIWYNQPDIEFYQKKTKKAMINVPQAEDWKTLIKQKKQSVIIKEITTETKLINIKGLEFTILSPTLEVKNKLYEVWLKERNKVHSVKAQICASMKSYSKSLEELSKIDFKPKKTINSDIYNSSSIAFILKCPDLSILLLADARAEIISNNLKELYNETKPLEVDFVKISHHGSLNNTSQELLSLIKSNNYIISTNGGSSNHKHPSRETIARIVYKTNRTDSTLNIYTNYEVDKIKNKIGEFITQQDLEKGNWNIEHKNTFTKDDK
ncbi:MBL fold metallo-hydrolase [Flavobacterium branchiarum]|uniref:ComEC/Rec2 family competence protein n=1 Tax=Flavobacterium branchiarum TaxID=1114870 RepID=A0ABV5FI28_9FLAO|nr:MBL fold metallo-hydrolase [Flavobacterium branchiarum]MDN3674103.1 MBL fold metallo-hydrolase [Flavobacterium branchiarum]